MPAKMARSAPRSPFGLPEATAVVRAASLSCQNEGKAPKFSRNRESSGESRFRALVYAWDGVAPVRQQCTALLHLPDLASN